ncbi:MAG: tRNA uridine-5-carboxymethylaminomethyl(34) synthesis enzyme MnmG [Nitrospirae bacterium]|nr:MAG: tRNA uridine-5-carboxymethylaminomethyl(34) synthesis enzyme MnmG [Nitrospirota bacterium]
MISGDEYDVIVIGAGHAGCEAALATARLGLHTCLFTMNLDTIAQMSCNPAIGGLAKGHLVREIDALGGEMARVTDRAGIQFRILNRSKGPAVWSLRAQADRLLYRLAMRQVLEEQTNLVIKQAQVEEILCSNGRVTGVRTSLGVSHRARAVIVTTGTFLRGLIHIGLDSHEAGRAGEFPAISLSDSLSKLGLKLGRLKTGTPPRLDAKSIDFSILDKQWGDDPPPPFSHTTREITNPQLPCYITYTNEETHKLIRENLDRSPLYSGKITGIGPRYCPSIEDKVVRFAERHRHQVFLEPEGLKTTEYYANGISTSLPFDVQIKMVRSIRGLEEAEIMRPGYAIEYDFVYPTQLKHSLETRQVQGLFLAGQINGTSGYEEAAAQGLMAGINAANLLLERPPLILGRDEAYIGVLIDDLVTKGTSEPYRMFTSRAEFRLLLRHDNADLRLTEKGYRIGLIDEGRYSSFLKKKEGIGKELRRLKDTRVTPAESNSILVAAGSTPLKEPETLEQLLKRPELSYSILKKISPPVEILTEEMERIVETEVKYHGYIMRQKAMVQRMKKLEDATIPDDIDYEGVAGLSKEVIAKLKEVRPETIGQASRIPGVTPAAIALIMLAIEKKKRTKRAV